MTLTKASVGLLLIGALFLSGCSANTNSDIAEPAPSPTPTEDVTTPAGPSPTPMEDTLGEAELVPPGYMPVIIPHSEIPNITIGGDYEISQDDAKKVYEWVASLAWLSINDGNLRGDPSDGEQIVQGLIPYLTDEATQQVLTAVRAWSTNPRALEADVFLSTLLEPMFFLASPDNGGLGVYRDDPVYSNVKIDRPTLARIENNGVGARYQLTFDITAALYTYLDDDTTCIPGGENPCQELFYWGMAYPHYWEIIETGNPDAPYMLDYWSPSSAFYGNLTPVSP